MQRVRDAWKKPQQQQRERASEYVIVSLSTFLFSLGRKTKGPVTTAQLQWCKWLPRSRAPLRRIDAPRETAQGALALLLRSGRKSDDGFSVLPPLPDTAEKRDSDYAPLRAAKRALSLRLQKTYWPYLRDVARRC